MRYFMTVTEAAQLVIQAGAMGKSSEIFLLDMGESVKIKDLIYKNQMKIYINLKYCKILIMNLIFSADQVVSLFRNDFVCEFVGHELFFLMRLVLSISFSEKFPKAGGGVPGGISSGWPQSSEN